MTDKMKTTSNIYANLIWSGIISFVLGIISINQQPPERPDCPYCLKR